jgi:hypothetical protein
MDFKNFGWSELITLIGIAVLTSLIFTGHMDGAVGGPIIAGMVTGLMAMRKINNGQALKVQAGQTAIETAGDSRPAAASVPIASASLPAAPAVPPIPQAPIPGQG